jgi:hypothetical protein
MAFSEKSTQITFAAANTKSVAAGATELSDAVTLDANAVERELSVKATNNGGTPAAGDVIEVHWVPDSDIDADATGDSRTDGTLVCTIGATSAGAKSKDAALVTVRRPGKVKLVSSAAANSVTCAVHLIERLWS